ncbi:MAG: tRNA (adenosine(37)-N6)-threonylcarbamoyltransferase complex transferase subunit TsaD [Candidatus Eutrophobiaceae bacterium]
MRILGIETSCDETGVALYDSEQGILADALHSQATMHAPYGGVVPELASRDHIRRILPLLDQVLSQARCSRGDLDAIAYTRGPGLIGALLAGTATACGIAHALNIPVAGIHHMEGHLLSPMLEADKPTYPFLALLISGGHTLLVEVRAWRDYRMLGESLDDAVGEAFDKTAKLLGLPYPGGKPLSDLSVHGNPKRFHFPRPMTGKPGLDFSFSGLKTHALLCYQAHGNEENARADIARAFVDAVVDTLLIKCERAMRKTGLREFVVSGGVSANTQLRTGMRDLGERLGARFMFPRLQWCTDNGAMIAYAGYLQLRYGRSQDANLQPRAKWPLKELKND